MKKLLLGVALGALAAAPAFAADLPARTYSKAPVMVDPGYNWSGFYLGVNVGGDWRRDPWNFVMDPGTHIGLAANIALVNTAGTGSNNGTSFIGGGQIGYNWQAPGSKWVVGVEADFSGISTRTRTATGFLVGGEAFSITESDRANWLATFRARVGYAWDRSLLYVTGGLAVADIRLASTYADALNATTGAGSRTGVRAGFAVGAGWEQALAQNWSVKVEYLYTQFDRVNFDYVATSILGGTNAIHVSDRISDNIGRIGLNYKWGGPVVARY
jgi:outer membrane immunogenic protein